MGGGRAVGNQLVTHPPLSTPIPTEAKRMMLMQVAATGFKRPQGRGYYRTWRSFHSMITSSEIIKSTPVCYVVPNQAACR